MPRKSRRPGAGRLRCIFIALGIATLTAVACSHASKPETLTSAQWATQFCAAHQTLYEALYAALDLRDPHTLSLEDRRARAKTMESGRAAAYDAAAQTVAGLNLPPDDAVATSITAEDAENLRQSAALLTDISTGFDSAATDADFAALTASLEPLYGKYSIANYPLDGDAADLARSWQCGSNTLGYQEKIPAFGVSMDATVTEATPDKVVVRFRIANTGQQGSVNLSAITASLFYFNQDEAERWQDGWPAAELNSTLGELESAAGYRFMPLYPTSDTQIPQTLAANDAWTGSFESHNGGVSSDTVAVVPALRSMTTEKPVENYSELQDVLAHTAPFLSLQGDAANPAPQASATAPVTAGPINGHPQPLIAETKCPACGFQWQVGLVESTAGKLVLQLDVQNTGEGGNIDFSPVTSLLYFFTTEQASTWREGLTAVLAGTTSVNDALFQAGYRMAPLYPAEGTTLPAALASGQSWSGHFETHDGGLPEDGGGFLVGIYGANLENSLNGRTTSSIVSFNKLTPLLVLP